MTSTFKVTASFFIGILMVILILWGNPGNMGICSLCFVRDISGALGLHSSRSVQYLRPEIIGIILGSAIVAILRKQFIGLSSSMSLYRFIVGFWMAIGGMVFLGCPFRLLQRLGGGDGTAIFGAIGFIAGVRVGMIFEKVGYTLPESLQTGKHIAVGGITFALSLLLLLILSPVGLHFSNTGIGALHAPAYISLLIGTITGGLLQVTSFCTISMARGVFSYKKRIFLYMALSLLIGYTLTAFIGGSLNPGFSNQPAAHNDYIWNTLSMGLVGFAGVLAKGCPMRQIVMTGEGSSDAFCTLLGMMVGTAIAHNFSLVSSTTGASTGGKIMVVIGLLFCSIIAITQTLYTKKLKYEEIISRY